MSKRLCLWLHFNVMLKGTQTCSCCISVLFYVQTQLLSMITGDGRRLHQVSYPVELGPAHVHVAVVLCVDTRAVEALLSQEDQVLLRQAPAALHFRYILHVQSLTELWPQHLVRHHEGHPSLSEEHSVMPQLLHKDTSAHACHLGMENYTLLYQIHHSMKK